jgi:hypothetical protein
MTDNPLIRGGDEIDIMSDEAKRELRTQFMRHWRIIRTWEPDPCPPNYVAGALIPERPDAVYADTLSRPWLRS